MQLKEIMTTDVITICSDKSVLDAAKLMQSFNVGAIPVCTGDRLQGMITDRDITIRAVANDLDPAYTFVRDIIKNRIFYCYEDQTAEEAAKIMEDKQIRRLPIISRDKCLVGIVSLGDLAVKEKNKLISLEALEHISQPDFLAS